MRAKLFASQGLALLLLSIPYFLLALQAVLAGAVIAVSLCPDPCTNAHLAVAVPRLVLSEHDSMPITAVLSTSQPDARAVTVTIQAPGFETNPPEAVHTVTVAPGQETRVSWLLTSKAAGTQTVSVGIKESTYVYSLQVAPIPLLTGQQAQLLSYAGAVMGVLLLLVAVFTAVRERRAGQSRVASSRSTQQPTPLT